MSQFTALNGAETLEVILTKIRAALVNTGEFKQHTAFPLIRFDYDIKVWSYPKQQLNGEPGIKVSAEVGEASGEATLSVTNNSELIDTPDKERQAAGLELPRPTSAAGVQVDKRLDKPVSPSRAESLSAAVAAAIPAKPAAPVVEVGKEGKK